MVSQRMFSRVPRTLFTLGRSSPAIDIYRKQHRIPQYNAVNSPSQFLYKAVGGYANQLCHPSLNPSAYQYFSVYSFASSETSESEARDSSKGQADDTVENVDVASTNENAKVVDQSKSEEDKAASDQTNEPDSSELSKEDLVKLVTEKDGLLKLKLEEVDKLRDKVLRSYADLENVMDRTRREAENTKKFAIQNFAKCLLDVADNLERASSVVRGSFSKMDASKDAIGAFPLLKTLLEGVEMTEKQLAEAFRKFGVEKFDPMNEPFSPHTHNAIFQIPDGSKPPGTVAAVMKSGYMLYDRVIRPAEVGVTKEVGGEESTKESKPQTGVAEKAE